MTPEKNEGQPRPFLHGFRKVVEEWRQLPKQILQTPDNLRNSLWPNWSEMREVYGYLYNGLKDGLRNSCNHRKAH